MPFSQQNILHTENIEYCGQCQKAKRGNASGARGCEKCTA